MERIEKLKLMLEQSSEDCFLWHALGLEYIKVNELKQAEASFEKVLTINEDYVGTYYHLAHLYLQTNQHEAALATFEKGIEVATRLKDMHARNELQMALDEFEDA